MPLLNESLQEQLKQTFTGLTEPVKLVLFTRENSESASADCVMCGDTRQLVEEITQLDEKLSLEILDYDHDQIMVERYAVDKVPAIVLLHGADQVDYGIRLYGIPSGYEFGTLIEDILLVSSGQNHLTAQTLTEIARLDRPVHIQVFTTPT